VWAEHKRLKRVFDRLINIKGTESYLKSLGAICDRALFSGLREDFKMAL